MAVEVKLYNNQSDPRKVHKSISLLKTISDCQIAEDCTIENPRLILQLGSDIDISKVNYCYISNFGRYYFLRPGIISGDEMEVIGDTDVLMSFYASFSNSSCVAERSTSNYNPELPDEMLPFKSQPKIIYRKLASAAFTPGANSGSYILCVGGKN